MTDARSSLANKIMNANPRAYQALVVKSSTSALAHELLANVQPDQLLAAPPKSPVAASAILAGLWLWHDSLDKCHEIVQKSPEALLAAATNAHRAPSKLPQVSNAAISLGQAEIDRSRDPKHLRELESTLAYWHAIMHRREGDFSNSKYWLARCTDHQLYPTFAVKADDLIRPSPADKSIFRLTAQGWNAPAFVDLVESIHNKPTDPRHALSISLQQLEWHLLFDHCTRAAAGN